MRALLTFLFALLPAVAPSAQQAPDDEPQRIADGVWFLPSRDVGRLGSNVAWIETARFVVVVDAAFPLGAERALRAIKATTTKPIRYAVMTHHHGDHAFGSGAFAKEGAVVVAQENAAHDYAANLAAYRQRQERDPVAKKYEPYAPEVTFRSRLTLAEGDRPIELLYFGHAHTRGDLFVWLPRERILCTGDACVSGAMSYLGDSDTASWIDVLAKVRALDPKLVLPGHGAVGGGELLVQRQNYFRELRGEVARLLGEGASTDDIRTNALVPTWRQWTTEPLDPQHVRHVVAELTRGAGAGLASRRGDAIAIPVPAGATPPRLVFLSGPLDGPERATLAALAPNVEIVIAADADAANAHIGRVHGMDARFCTSDLLRQAPNLRWVQSMSAGVERYVTIPELLDNDAILITNMAGMYGTAIADHTLAMTLALARGLPHWFEQQQGAHWARDDALAQTELTGKTMLVLGLGGIGREVAQRAHGFGMRVLGTVRTPRDVPSYVERVHRSDETDALLPSADVVAICLPLTDATRKMFDAARLARMKPGAVLLNVGRGAIVDTDALVEALKSGHLGGAGLDVVEPEPLPSTHPLWAMKNVILTPHVSGRSPLSETKRFELFAENMRRFARGEALLNLVDKREGY